MLLEQPFNLLYVDDEVNLLSAFQRIFRAEKVNVTTTESVEKALKLLNDKEFHVIASDYRMPVMDGIQFLEKASQLAPEAMRILITGMCDFEAAVDAINRGKVFRFISKPWNNDDLRSSVSSALDQIKLKLENEELSRIVEERNRELNEINLGLDREVDQRTTDLLNGLICALDLRDTETQWHSRRVSLYAKLLATRMDVNGQDLIDIERGALLHDIGKIGVRDSILLKPSKLTPEEWVEMRRHPDYGYKLLEGIRFLDSARLIVLHHQERFDGSGYPSMLRGNEIALGARIFSVVDTLDAMTSDRPYRKAVDFDVSKQEIIRCAGTQLDPRVVEAFCSIPENEFRAIRDMLPDNPQEGADGIRWGSSIAASRLLRDLGGR